MTLPPMLPQQQEEILAYSVFNIKPVNPSYSFQLLPEQTAHLHNMLVEESENMLALVYDEHNPVGFAQKQAYIKARIDILTEILNEGN